MAWRKGERQSTSPTPYEETFWNIAAGNRSACKSLLMSIYSFIEYRCNGEAEERRQTQRDPFSRDPGFRGAGTGCSYRSHYECGRDCRRLAVYLLQDEGRADQRVVSRTQGGVGGFDDVRFRTKAERAASIGARVEWLRAVGRRQPGPAKGSQADSGLGWADTGVEAGGIRTVHRNAEDDGGCVDTKDI